MNVIVSNKNKTILDGLSIEVIKRLEGEYSVDEIIDTFQNFFFNRMIIDVTAIRDYRNLSNLQKLSTSFDMSKVILLLESDEDLSSSDFISKIISMGIYNFASNLEGIMYLYNNPNSYSNVAQYHHIDNLIVDDFNDNERRNDDSVSEITVETGSVGADLPKSKSNGPKIIGFKSVTPGAGSTTLIYLMKKQLEKHYNVLAVEVEKRDFIYFNDKSLVSSANGVIGQILSTNKDKDVMLVDLNGSPAAENYCTDVIHLIEPSIIKINRLLSIKPKILNELKGKRVVLCKSLLSDKDVKDFEYESALNVFYNLKPVDDHVASHEVSELLRKLGFDKIK